MSSQSRKIRNHTVRGDYGFARARDIAFDAVLTLWDKRRKQGMKQSDLATVLNRDPGWVCTQLKGPGNWTLRTFGELVESMNGEVEIRVYGKEEPVTEKSNFDAYLSSDNGPARGTKAEIVFDPPIKPLRPNDSTKTDSTSTKYDLELV